MILAIISRHVKAQTRIYPAAVGVGGTAAADAKGARYRGLGWGGVAPVTCLRGFSLKPSKACSNYNLTILVNQVVLFEKIKSTLSRQVGKKELYILNK